MRRDIFSAYAASASRILSWVIVSALVYRRSPEAFAMLALVRGTLGILNYCSLGLLPAMIQALASMRANGTRSVPATSVASAVRDDRLAQLEYETPETARARLNPPPDPLAQRVFSTGTALAFLSAMLGIGVTSVLTQAAIRVYQVPSSVDPEDVMILVLAIGTGIVLRWLSEPAGAVLQTRDSIAADNLLLAASETAWVILAWIFCREGLFRGAVLRSVGFAHAVSGGLLVLARGYAANAVAYIRMRLAWDTKLLRVLVGTGTLITLAQLADYLYAPTDYILINRLLTARDLANYAPALQIDGGLMVLVGGLAAVLLPKAAIAHGAGDRAAVKAYYVRGTLASAGLLAAASVVVYVLSPWIFRLWLGDPMPGTRAILPLVLFHTTLGGSALIGRSILLAIGRTKPFTVSVLIAGVTNVVASYAFVRLGWGLKGIVLGTIVAVVARCGVWMPWYVMRHLGDPRGAGPVALAESP